mmetsp:Transcript_43594/g.115015  ORF Transcript_43594/g.115015 Transcript_43594/m.115015 type:complete len:124 (-) Transcript_43594:9-380(-)
MSLHELGSSRLSWEQKSQDPAVAEDSAALGEWDRAHLDPEAVGSVSGQPHDCGNSGDWSKMRSAFFLKGLAWHWPQHSRHSKHSPSPAKDHPAFQPNTIMQSYLVMGLIKRPPELSAEMAAGA